MLPDGEPEALGVPVSDGDPVGRPVGVSDADGLPVGRPVGVGVPEGSTEVTVSVGTGIVGPPLLSAGFGASDVGRERTLNEDAYVCDPDRALFVVCDGMGGHAAGEEASAHTVRTVHAAVHGAAASRIRPAM